MSEKYWRKNKLAHSFALLSVVALAATGTFAVEESAKLSGQGLSGIFPAVPPADLSSEEFAKLDGNWAEWSKGAAEAVADFYAKIEGSDSAAQRQALGKLKVKLDVMRRALADPRYASLYGPLSALYSSLSIRIDFAEAALDTLDLNSPENASGRLKSRTSELSSSIGLLEDYLASITNGNLWVGYFKIDALKAAVQADPNAAATVEAAKRTQTTLQSRDYLLDGAQKDFAKRGPFNSLATAVDRFVSAAAWTDSAAAIQKLRGDFKSLAESLDTYESLGEKAGNLRKAMAQVRFVSIDGGERLNSTLQKSLFNYNLRIVASEPFLNKMIAQNRCDSGPVRDCILGANVTGCQVTGTTVSMDLIPSRTDARFMLKINGNIRSTTTATTPEATVFTSGNHTFVASKEVHFDGKNFSTSPGTISVSPHNTTTGINTKFSGVPILRRVAQNIASGEVEAKRGQAEAIAASRVQDQVLPRFNQEADSNFSNAGGRLDRELFSGLRASNLFPDAYAYETSDRTLTANIRVMTEHQVAADVPDSSLLTLTETDGARTLMHSSIVNNAIDQMGIAGQTLNEPELRAKIEDFLSKALNRPFKFEAPPPDHPDAGEEEKSLSAIIFAQDDPIRVKIQDNMLTIIIRAGFKREGKDDIPMRLITVPISMEVVGKQISMKRGDVVVVAADGKGGDNFLNRVVSRKIQTVLPDRVVDGKVEFKSNERTVVAYVTNLKFVDGWIAISLN